MPDDLQTQRCRRYPRVMTMTIARDPRTLWRAWQIQRSAKNQTQIDNRPSLILHRPLPMATDHNNLMVSGQTEYAVRRNLTLSEVRFGGVSDTMDLAHGARYHTGPGTPRNWETRLPTLSKPANNERRIIERSQVQQMRTQKDDGEHPSHELTARHTSLRASLWGPVTHIQCTT